MVKKVASKSQETKTAEPQQKKAGFFDYLRFGESYTSLILGVIVVIIATALMLSFVHNKNTGPVNTSVLQKTQNTVQISQKASSLAEKTSSGDINTAVSIAPTTTIAPVKASVRTKTQLSKTPQVKTDKDNNVWIVQKGESLWTIAEKKYTSGYNWVDIARANKLANPSDIHAGDRLILPSVTPKQSTIVMTEVTVTPVPSQKVVATAHKSAAMGKITGKVYTVVKGDNLWDIAVRAYGDGYKWTAIAKANKLANPGLIFSGNRLIIPRN